MFSNNLFLLCWTMPLRIGFPRIEAAADCLTSFVVFVSRHRPSLLCRILGHHQIRKTKSSGGSTKKLSLFFVVMANCFKGTLSIDRRFDLKGSWVGRSTKSEEARSNPKTCLKDTDVMDMHQVRATVCV